MTICKDSITQIVKLLKPFADMGVISGEVLSETSSVLKDYIKPKPKPHKPLLKDVQLSKPQIAERLGKSVETVKNLEKEGLIRRIEGIKGHPRYWLSEIIAYENGGT